MAYRPRSRGCVKLVDVEGWFDDDDDDDDDGAGGGDDDNYDDDADDEADDDEEEEDDDDHQDEDDVMMTPSCITGSIAFWFKLVWTVRLQPLVRPPDQCRPCF